MNLYLNKNMLKVLMEYLKLLKYLVKENYLKIVQFGYTEKMMNKELNLRIFM